MNSYSVLQFAVEFCSHVGLIKFLIRVAWRFCFTFSSGI